MLCALACVPSAPSSSSARGPIPLPAPSGSLGAGLAGPDTVTVPTTTSASMAASNSSSPPIAVFAAELARILLIAKTEGKARGSEWVLHQKACTEVLGPRCASVKQFEDAFVRLHAGGHALSVVVSSQCFGDGCSIEAWLYTDIRAPRSVPEPPFVVVPGLSALIFDRIKLVEPGKWDSRLARLDLETGAETPFADCVSPSLSPSEKWIACRTIDWGVYRVPIAGGKPMLVRKGPGPISWVPYAHFFPPPISFPSPTTFSVNEDGASEVVLPWSE